jgi:tetratricopeptide (TPR) repeat protein
LGILTSLLLGAAVGIGLFLPHHSLSALLVWGLTTAVASFILIGRRAAKRIEPLMADSQKHIQAGRIDKAVETLSAGFKVGRWHPLLPGQIEAQVGILLYVAGRADEALPHLERASRFVWVAKAMLGCHWFKKKEPEKMRAPFERAVRTGKKESLSWTLYAYCLRESGHKDEALALLERAAKVVTKATKKTDHRLETNLERLREGKPLKTAPYGEQWLQFRLDKSPPPIGRGPRGRELDPNHPALRGLRGRRARHM